MAANPRLLRGKPLYYGMYSGTSEWKFLAEKYKINVILAKGEYNCGIEEKTRCNSTVTKDKEIFIAAEVLLLK